MASTDSFASPQKTKCPRSFSVQCCNFYHCLRPHLTTFDASTTHTTDPRNSFGANKKRRSIMLSNDMAQLLGIPSGAILNVTIVNDNAVRTKSSITQSKQNSTRAVKRQKSFESLHSMPAQPRRGIRRQYTPCPIERPATEEITCAPSEHLVLNRWGEEQPAHPASDSTSRPTNKTLEGPRSNGSLLEMLAYPSPRFQDQQYSSTVILRPNLHRWGDEQPSCTDNSRNAKPLNGMLRQPSRSNDSLLELMASSSRMVQDLPDVAMGLMKQ